MVELKVGTMVKPTAAQKRKMRWLFPRGLARIVKIDERQVTLLSIPEENKTLSYWGTKTFWNFFVPAGKTKRAQKEVHNVKQKTG